MNLGLVLLNSLVKQIWGKTIGQKPQQKYQQTFEVNLLTRVGGRDAATSTTYTDIVSPSEINIKVTVCLLFNSIDPVKNSWFEPSWDFYTNVWGWFEKMKEWAFSQSPKVFCAFFIPVVRAYVGSTEGYFLAFVLADIFPGVAISRGREPSSCHFWVPWVHWLCSPWYTAILPTYNCHHSVVVYWPFRHGRIPKWGLTRWAAALPGLVASYSSSRMCCWDFCCWQQPNNSLASCTHWPDTFGTSLRWYRTQLTQWSCKSLSTFWLTESTINYQTFLSSSQPPCGLEMWEFWILVWP